MPSSKKKTSKAPKAPKSAATAPDADLFYMGDDSHTEVTRCKETVLNEDCSVLGDSDGSPIQVSNLNNLVRRGVFKFTNCASFTDIMAIPGDVLRRAH